MAQDAWTPPCLYLTVPSLMYPCLRLTVCPEADSQAAAVQLAVRLAAGTCLLGELGDGACC